MHRKRRADDDLYSNLNVTTEPVIAIYVGNSKTESNNKMVMIGNAFWEVHEKEMKFYFDNNTGGINVYQAS